MRRKTILGLNAVCPIAVGAFIYYLVSPDVIFVKGIDAMIGDTVNLHITLTDHVLFKLVRNYFLDMLWGYAFVFALFYIVGNNAVKIEKIFVMVFAFSIVMEILQIIPFVQGTFDFLDICTEFLAEIIAAFIINTIYPREEFQDEKEKEMVICNAVSGCVCSNGIRERLDKGKRDQAGCCKRKRRDIR